MLENTFMRKYNSSLVKEVPFSILFGSLPGHYSPIRDINAPPGHVFKSYDGGNNIKILVVTTRLGHIVVHENSYNRPPYIVNPHPKIPNSFLALAGWRNQDDPSFEVIENIVGSPEGSIKNLGQVLEDTLNWEEIWKERCKTIDNILGL